MICPTCSAADQLSTVRIVRTNPGPLARDHFFDERGQEHSHNPNIVITEFRCSNGHAFAERSSWQCIVCGYKACDAEIVVGEIAESSSAPTAGVRRDPVVPEAIAKKREKEKRKR